ncbi:putative T7SS-secreted protein [Dactylosporangium sp. CS-047395]|uniref:putative T7SS-secreted protein n=1 Tax=Dactylosporangium sp. CS-047395 TaxID=3239936 RepID=UPI003D90D415
MTTTAALRTTTVLRGGDPAPGDGWAVQEVIRQLRDTVTAVQSASAVLTGIGTDRDVWTGPAAEAFAPRKEDLSRRLATAGRAYGRAADALDHWWRRLSDLQTEAAEVAALARRAHDEHQAEQARLAACSPGPPPVVPPGPPPAVVALQRRHDAIAADAARDRKACEAEIDAAAAELGGSGGRGFFEMLKGALVEGAEILHTIREVLGVVALIATFFPVIAPFVDTLYLAVAAISLVVDLTLVATGDGDWGTVGESALSVVLGGVGKLGTVARTGAQNAGKLEFAADAAKNSARFGEKAAPILLALGMTDKAAVTAAKAGLAAERSADYATTAIHVAGDTTRTGVVAGAVRETLHPIQAGREAKAVQDLIKESSGYGRLPKLEQWVPAGHRAPAIGGMLAEGADKGYEVYQDYKKVDKWIKGQTGE